LYGKGGNGHSIKMNTAYNTIGGQKIKMTASLTLILFSRDGNNYYMYFLWPPCVADADIIFSSNGFSFFFFFLFPLA